MRKLIASCAWPILLLFSAIFLSGCFGAKDYAHIAAETYVEKGVKASTVLVEAEKEGFYKDNAFSYYFDKALLDHYAGDFKKSTITFDLALAENKTQPAVADVLGKALADYLNYAAELRNVLALYFMTLNFAYVLDETSVQLYGDRLSRSTAKLLNKRTNAFPVLLLLQGNAYEAKKLRDFSYVSALKAYYTLPYFLQSGLLPTAQRFIAADVLRLAEEGQFPELAYLRSSIGKDLNRSGLAVQNSGKIAVLHYAPLLWPLHAVTRSLEVSRQSVRAQCVSSDAATALKQLESCWLHFWEHHKAEVVTQVRSAFAVAGKGDGNILADRLSIIVPKVADVSFAPASVGVENPSTLQPLIAVESFARLLEQSVQEHAEVIAGFLLLQAIAEELEREGVYEQAPPMFAQLRQAPRLRDFASPFLPKAVQMGIVGLNGGSRELYFNGLKKTFNVRLPSFTVTHAGLFEGSP